MSEHEQQYDISDFYGVDLAFGCHIIDALKELNPEHCPHHVKAFLKRETKQQVIRADYESPREFIRAVRQFQKQAGSDGERKFNQASLPLINYFRPLKFENAPAEYAQFVESTTGFDDKLLQQTNISISYLSLTYRVVFMATDKASVERLLLAWHMYIGKRNAGGHRLNVTYNLCGGEFEFPLTIEDSQSISTENLSSIYGEGRLFAVAVEHVVNAPVLYGKEVAIVPNMRWDLGVSIFGNEEA